MDNSKRNEMYNKYVMKKIPMTKEFPSLIYSFIVGGIICCIGQGVFDALTAIWPSMSIEEATSWMLIILIVVASFLTGLGVYDRIGVFAGAGSIVPITGFSNSITSPAIEFKKEGIIFGLCVKMFSVAGPVIVNGVTISVVIGIIYLFIWGSMKRIGKQTVVFTNKPMLVGNYSVVGEKEGCGNFKEYFHYILKDDKFGEGTFEKAEQKILEHTLFHAVKSAGLNINDIDVMVCGDLLNQIITSTFSARKFAIPYLGLYGACSTMAEALAISALIVDAGYLTNVLCGTGTHFSSAERQYRFPLELGNQRPPTSQWTITGAGASVISRQGVGHYIVNATFGRVVDFGIKDVNNMGAAMAPAAMDTLIAHFEDTKTKPQDYDLIVTGDLGKLGSEILMDLMENKGFKLHENYCDCGHMMFNDNQRTFQGGSGAGCSASVLNSYILAKLTSGEYNRVLFCATGALLSTLSSQQGESIPGICHAVEIVRNSEVTKWR